MAMAWDLLAQWMEVGQTRHGKKLDRDGLERYPMRGGPLRMGLPEKSR